ncbi:MAG: PHP domain-containing protein [Actinomycetota bacterium]|jgi:predicted metal-dependent phosphoesterase TrpH|nr:PHP domain-containing protein [Actinomycetota bacterium]
MPGPDFHVHSVASDGTLSAPQLVARALSLGLSGLSITDHDSVDSVSGAIDAARGTDLTIVPGVELSSVHNGRDVHILGYFADITSRHFREHLDDLRTARATRAKAIVDALSEAGINVDLTDILELSDGGAVGRSHVARALVARGHADTVSDAFRHLLGRGRPFYVPKDVRSPAEVIGVIRDAGGLAVLAHPGITQVDGLIPDLVSQGLRGIEAYHGEHSESARRLYVTLAEEYGLIVTGGSDFHHDKAPGPGIGGADVPESVLPTLLTAARDAHCPGLSLT